MIRVRIIIDAESGEYLDVQLPDSDAYRRVAKGIVAGVTNRGFTATANLIRETEESI